MCGEVGVLSCCSWRLLTAHPPGKHLATVAKTWALVTASDLLRNKYLLLPFCCWADRLVEVKYLGKVTQLVIDSTKIWNWLWVQSLVFPFTLVTFYACLMPLAPPPLGRMAGDLCLSVQESVSYQFEWSAGRFVPTWTWEGSFPNK